MGLNLEFSVALYFNFFATALWLSKFHGITIYMRDSKTEIYIEKIEHADFRAAETKIKRTI